MKKLSFAILLAVCAATAASAGSSLLGHGYEFIKAVRESDGAKATELLRVNPPSLVDARDNDGNTALILAIVRRDPEWTGFLITKGADVNLAGKGGDTPLIAAARTGFSDAAEWLLAKGAKVNAANRMGETALIVAVQRREPAIVRKLLEAGADPDKTDSAAGYSARDYAARDSRSRQMLQLIEAKKPKPAASQ